jgi:hypothetical protein
VEERYCRSYVARRALVTTRSACLSWSEPTIRNPPDQQTIVHHWLSLVDLLRTNHVEFAIIKTRPMASDARWKVIARA